MLPQTAVFLWIFLRICSGNKERMDDNFKPTLMFANLRKCAGIPSNWVGVSIKMAATGFAFALCVFVYAYVYVCVGGETYVHTCSYIHILNSGECRAKSLKFDFNVYLVQIIQMIYFQGIYILASYVYNQ